MPMPQDDLYDSEPSPTRQGPADDGESAEPKQDDEGGETALIPSSICPGMKPGEEIVLKIQAVHDDQYAVEYAKKPKEDQGDEGMEAAPMPGSMASAGDDGNYS